MQAGDLEPPEPQAVSAPLTKAAIFLMVQVEAGAEQTAKDLLADLAGLQRAVGFRDAGAGLTCVAGISSAAWDRIYGDPRPAELHELPVFSGEKHTSVVTAGADLLFHLRADRLDLCFELESLIMDRLRGSVRVLDEVQGFRYFDARDVLGFVDGTENPTGKGVNQAVLVDDDGPFNRGSYVVVQKYLHDMRAWNALTTEQQELVIGRRKLSDVEMPDEEKPANAHVALNVITDDEGNELDILRDNMPFGRPGHDEFGTYFIGYTKSPAVIEKMLENMFVGSPRGTYDRILDFSTPHTGALFYVPTADFLEDPNAAPPEPEPPAAATPAGSSLGIGSLRRSTRS